MNQALPLAYHQSSKGILNFLEQFIVAPLHTQSSDMSLGYGARMRQKSANILCAFVELELEHNSEALCLSFRADVHENVVDQSVEWGVTKVSVYPVRGSAQLDLYLLQKISHFYEQLFRKHSAQYREDFSEEVKRCIEFLNQLANTLTSVYQMHQTLANQNIFLSPLSEITFSIFSSSYLISFEKKTGSRRGVTGLKEYQCGIDSCVFDKNIIIHSCAIEQSDGGFFVDLLLDFESIEPLYYPCAVQRGLIQNVAPAFFDKVAPILEDYITP